MSPTGRPDPRRSRAKPAVAVVSPYADEDDVRTSPTWLERLRGVAGIGVLVVVSGVAVAALVALVLLAVAIFVATTFN